MELTTITSKLFSLLKLCSNTKSLNQIQTIHQQVISFGLQNNLTLSKSLINLYISCRALKSANSVFHSIRNPLDITLWNGLMATYTKNHLFIEALSLYENLLKFPYLKPDSYTYPSVLKACGGLKRVDLGKKIHSQLLKNGFLLDVVIASSLTGVYAKCGLFASAAKLFDEMPEKDLVCWNSVISCYYQSGQFKKALDSFEGMRRAGFTPDSVSFTTAISSCGRLLDLERGRRIHDDIVRNGLLSDGYISTSLVDMYGKCGSLDRAKEVFDRIDDKSLVCWNAMIGCYSQTGDSRSCIELLDEMRELNVQPSSTTISSLLLACAKSAQLLYGKFVHGYILRNNVGIDIFVESLLIDLYFKCGNVSLAENVFEVSVKSGIVSWNVMMSGYVSTGSYFDALRIFDGMKDEGMKPDTITLTNALVACSQLSALERGREFHNLIIENKFDSNEIVMGALLDMYAKCGAVEEAADVFNRLTSRDLVSWTSMIVAYGSHSRPFEALTLFDEMLRKNVKPDRVTFLAVISSCGHAGFVEKGQYYFNLMINEYQIQPSIAEYSCLVDLLCRAGRLHEAYEILEKNPFIKQDVDLLSTVFAACHMHGNFELGKKISSILVEKAPEDPSTYIVLEKMYAASKKWDEARKIRLKMKEMGLKKNPGCSWIEVDKTIQSFLAEDKTFEGIESVYHCLSLMYGHMENDETVEIVW